MEDLCTDLNKCPQDIKHLYPHQLKLGSTFIGFIFYLLICSYDYNVYVEGLLLPICV